MRITHDIIGDCTGSIKDKASIIKPCLVVILQNITSFLINKGVKDSHVDDVIKCDTFRCQEHFYLSYLCIDNCVQIYHCASLLISANYTTR